MKAADTERALQRRADLLVSREVFANVGSLIWTILEHDPEWLTDHDVPHVDPEAVDERTHEIAVDLTESIADECADLTDTIRERFEDYQIDNPPPRGAYAEIAVQWYLTDDSDRLITDLDSYDSA